MVREPALSCLRAVLFFGIAAPITVVDLRSLRIPGGLCIGGLAGLAFFDACLEPGGLAGDGFAAALAFALLAGVRSLTAGLGRGDLKYGALVAFYAGLPYCFVAVASAAAAALMAFLALSARDRAQGPGTMPAALPFAPFLTFGALVAGIAELAITGAGPRSGP